MKRRISRYGLHAGLTLALLAGAGAAPAWAECTESSAGGDRVFDLRLPAGQDSVQCRWDLESLVSETLVERASSGGEVSPSSFIWGGDVILNVRGSGLLLVDIGFQGSGLEAFPGTLELAGGDLSGWRNRFSAKVRDPNPKSYRFLWGAHERTLVAHIRDFLRQDPMPSSRAKELLDDRWDIQLVMTLRRVHGCWMSARVTGDVSTVRGDAASPRLFSGDLAYFLFSEAPVKKGMMVGSLADTDLHEMADGIGEINSTRDEALDLAVRMGLLSVEERNELGREDVDQEAPVAEGESFSEWVQQELRPGAGEDGDNFGISLADIDMDVTNKSVGGAVDLFARGFTLTLSGRLDSQSVTVSTATATVGLLEGAGRIPFEMSEGAQMSGAVQPLGEGHPDVIVGTVSGPMETKGVYTLEGIASSPRKLRIHLTAEFIARRGSFSCGP